MHSFQLLTAGIMGASLALAQMVPICDILQAANALNSSPMASQLSALPADTWSITGDSQTYTPGQQIKITMNGPSFDGFMMYANPKEALSARVGSFGMPQGMISNENVCRKGGMILDSPNSAIVSSNTGISYPGSQTIVWTAPQQSVGEVHLNVMVMKKIATGWGHHIVPCVLILKCAGTVVKPVALPPQQVVCPACPACPPKVICPAPVTVTKTLTQTQTQTVTSTLKVTVTQTVQVVQVQKQVQVRKCQRRNTRPTPTVVQVKPVTVKPTPTPKATPAVVKPTITPVIKPIIKPPQVIVKPVVQPTQCCLGETEVIVEHVPVYVPPPPPVIHEVPIYVPQAPVHEVPIYAPQAPSHEVPIYVPQAPSHEVPIYVPVNPASEGPCCQGEGGASTGPIYAPLPLGAGAGSGSGIPY
ncbi:hypothetical protein BDR26DRAFT_882042 [Obelidium mucronatum]|nr:hypothetical protein BDR26DRAFT_882042 [Obelidium mucronatum]